MSTAKTIDYYFSLMSPWAFLGHAPFVALAKQHSLTINYRPVFLGEVFAATGGLMLAQRPVSRQNYRLMELQRWRDKRGVALNIRPKHWPFNPKGVDGLCVAIIQAGHDPAAFIQAAYTASWCEARDIASDAELEALLTSCQLDAALLAASKTAEITKLYEQNAATAVKAGVFGSPSYVLNGEIFWGQDRLDLLEDALISGRAPYLANL